VVTLFFLRISVFSFVLLLTTNLHLSSLILKLISVNKSFTFFRESVVPVVLCGLLHDLQHLPGGTLPREALDPLYAFGDQLLSGVPNGLCDLKNGIREKI